MAFGRLSKSRGGAPRGERIPLDALPRPQHFQMATSESAARKWMVRLSALRLPCLSEHDLIRKPVTTFRDHALGETFVKLVA